MAPPKITPEIAKRYNRFNDARRKAGIPLIGDPMSVAGLKSDTLPKQRKGTSAYAQKPRRRAVPLMDNKKIAERKQKEQSKPAPKKAPAPAPTKASPPNFAKGGVVKKTGLAKVHKGEVVLTAAQAKRMKALFS